MSRLDQVKEEIAALVETINRIPNMKYGTAYDRALYQRGLDRKLGRLQQEREKLQQEREAVLANMSLEELFFYG